jgi:hypothetical protein
VFVYSSTYDPSSVFVSYYAPILVSSSLYDDIDDENPPPPTHLPLDDPIEHELALETPLLIWVRSTQEVVGDITNDPSYKRRTRSQFQRASSILDQFLETRDLETFVKDSSHLDWDTIMNKEYQSLLENDTWDLAPLLKGRKLVNYKWIYITKYASDGSVERHKAWLIDKGISQVEGIDYNETFSHVAKMNSIHLFLSLATSLKWEVHQMDLKSSFLHRYLQK